MRRYLERRPLMRCAILLAGAWLSWAALSGTAMAHSLGEGYLFLRVADHTLTGWLEITLTDLDQALDIDANADGKVTEAELEPKLEQAKRYVSERIGIGAGGRWFHMEYTGHEIMNRPQSRYLALYFDLAVQGPVPDVIDLRYEILFDRDPSHRGFLVIAENARTGVVNKGEDTALRFEPDKRAQSLDLNALSRWDTFKTFVRHGVWHIWIGIDHVLFLVALILPSVLVRREGRWEPVFDFAPALWQVVKIVTLFTIAHTITLSVAALDLIRLPGRLVESIIAASVVIAALNNLYPVVRQHMGLVVFGFGLFHGFGFASVLSHLVTNRSNLVVDLLGFNLGVEIGQVAIILITFPVLYALRHSGAYLRVLVPAGATAIALLALGWFVERAFDLDFLPV